MFENDANEKEPPQPVQIPAVVDVKDDVEEPASPFVEETPSNGSHNKNDEEADEPTTTTTAAPAESNHVKDAVVTDALGRTGMYTGAVLDPEASIKIPHDDSGTAFMVYDNCGVTRYEGGWHHGHWQSSSGEQKARIEYATGDVYTGSVAQSVRTGTSGTLQWKDGRKYVGDWRDGERHGRGIYEWPHAKYEGEFWHNQRQGQGVYESRTDSMHLLYTGEWHNNQYHGQGRYEITTTTTSTPPPAAAAAASAATVDEQEPQTKVFVGRFAHGKPVPEEFIEPEGASQQSQSEDTTDNTSAITVVTDQPWFDRGVPAVYRGLWLRDKHKPHGNGVADYQLGAVASYEGCFHHGLYHGEGRLLYRESGDCYTGSFQQGQRHGHGTYKWSDGRQYSGEWHKNVRGGRGVFTWPSTGDRYEGEFEQGQRHGQGLFVFGESGASYKGGWRLGLYHGRGRTVDATGAVYEGEFVDGQRHGHGVEYDPNGKLVYEGLWQEGYQATEVDDAEEAQQDEEEKKDETSAAPTTNQKQDKQEEEEEEERKECSVSVERLEIDDHQQTASNIPPPLAPPPATPPPPVPPTSEHLVQSMASQQRSVASDTSNSPRKSITSTNPNLLRSWYQPPSANPSPISGDEQNCRAVVDQAVTDQLECPGLYTGIVDADGRPHGVGRLVYSDGKRVHEGFWSHGTKQGHGRCLFYPQQDFHEGEYRSNLRHGEGLYQWKDGRKYVGNYEHDFRHGKGVFTYPNGERYDGLFFKGQRHGFGRFEFVEDKSDGRGKTMGYYEGEWQLGRYHGHGKIVWGSSGCSYEGEWEKGEMHGRGVKKDGSGTILLEGLWIRGRFFQDPNQSEGTVLESASDGSCGTGLTR